MRTISIASRAITSIWTRRAYEIFLAAPIFFVLGLIVLPISTYTEDAGITGLSAIAPGPWDLLVYAAVAVPLFIWLATGLAIGWHRSLLAPATYASPWATQRGQPRLRYVLRAALAFMVALGFAGVCTSVLMEISIRKVGSGAKFWFDMHTFAIQYSSRFIFTLAFVPLAISLPGIAVNGRSPLRPALGYAFRNLPMILVLGVGLAVLDWVICAGFERWYFHVEYEYKGRNNLYHNAYLLRHWAVFALNVVVEIPLYLLNLAIITELYHDYASHRFSERFT